ncbi:MAG: acyltransferase, partial [Akkermansiaceae bacterium]|nr:acyltransferase [Akkermansiaceae bacterium]
MKDNQIREHLDHVTGLRAVAILLVLLFHLDGVAWRHGYVGVDVFLVISGYLMLRARQRQVGLTSWRDALRYLGKRVRRLVPPMAVLLLLTLGGGFLLCEWEGIEEICKVGERTCWMNANDQINKMLADYFRPDKDYMPLLHMWYMSVVM